MLKDWLNSASRTNPTYKFPVVDLTERVEPTPEIIGFLANELMKAYESSKMLKAEYAILLEDVDDLNLDILKNYIETQVLPDTKKIATRIGNFGEVLCAQILVEFEGYWFPIYKLRYREKRDWAIRLTDLCLFKTDGLARPLVCYGEVKTHSSQTDVALAVKGHTSLAKDEALADPEILRFFSTMLYESSEHEKLDQADLISRIRLKNIEYDRRHLLFLVHEKESWNEAVLEGLNQIVLDPRLVDFSVTVITISKLRTLIDDSYNKVFLAARGIIND